MVRDLCKADAVGATGGRSLSASGASSLGLDGTERYVRDLAVKRLPGVSHWVQQDAPEIVNGLLGAFL